MSNLYCKEISRATDFDPSYQYAERSGDTNSILDKVSKFIKKDMMDLDSGNSGSSTSLYMRGNSRSKSVSRQYINKDICSRIVEDPREGDKEINTSPTIIFVMNIYII